jgi:hypothetical protein
MKFQTTSSSTYVERYICREIHTYMHTYIHKYITLHTYTHKHIRTHTQLTNHLAVTPTTQVERSRTASRTTTYLFVINKDVNCSSGDHKELLRPRAALLQDELSRRAPVDSERGVELFELVGREHVEERNALCHVHNRCSLLGGLLHFLSVCSTNGQCNVTQ